MRMSEAEFRRVVRHEAGHTLGFEHEHMRAGLVKRIDRRRRSRTSTAPKAGRAGDDRAGADAAREEVAHGHDRKRSALDHVLPDPGRDHEGRQGDPGGRTSTRRTSRSRPRSIRNPARVTTAAVRRQRGIGPGVWRHRPRDGARRPGADGTATPSTSSSWTSSSPRAGVGRGGPAAEVRQVFASYGGARVTCRCGSIRQGRRAHAVRRDHRHARAHQGVHEPRTGSLPTTTR